MPAIFSKNCILRGELDSYCLACSVYLTSEDDALSHIQGSKHKSLNKSLGYFEKYEEDLIRKVKGVYFCEVCNITFSTATKVKIHVTEDAHLAGKRARVLKRTDNGVVSAGGVPVAERAWHGLVDGACVLCGVDNVDMDIHMHEITHVINLINNKVIIANNDIYRKMDDVFHCLTCNKAFSEQALAKHLKSKEHKESSESIKTDQTQDKGSADSQKKNKDIQHNKVEKNLTRSGLIKKTEREIPIVPETEMFAKRELKKDNNDERGEQVSGTLDDIIKHLNIHKNKDNTKQTNTTKKFPKKIEKVPFKEYIQNIQVVQNSNGLFLILNHTICIEAPQFMGISRFHNKIICRFCEIDLTPQQLNVHFQNNTHCDSLVECYVITSVEDEFVRQFKTDMFDCGYCGKIETDYDDMLDHLATAEHKKIKALHESKLYNLNLQLSEERRRNISFPEFFMSNLDLFNRHFN